MGKLTCVLFIVVIACFGCKDRTPGATRPYGAEIYLRGTLFKEEESASWAVCDERNRMARKGDYEYELIMPIKAGVYRCKIADASWQVVNLGRANDYPLKLKQPYHLTFADDARDIWLRIDVDGTYRFYLEAANRNKPLLIVEARSALSRE